MSDKFGGLTDSIAFCPRAGGAISNLYSVIVARQKLFPEYKTKGLRALPSQLVLFTSEHVSSMKLSWNISTRAATIPGPGLGPSGTCQISLVRMRVSGQINLFLERLDYCL